MSQGPEEVALSLLHMVAAIENKRISHDGSGNPATRNWLFSTYRQCLKTVTKPILMDMPVGPRAAEQDQTDSGQSE
jgi:hypothetical protein